MAGDVSPVAMFFNCISDGFTLDILLNLNWNFQKISNGIALKFQLDFLWISIDMWIKFQLDFLRISICIPLKFIIKLHWNFNWIIGISNSILLKFLMNFNRISNGFHRKIYWISCWFPLEFYWKTHWSFIIISTGFQMDFHWY